MAAPREAARTLRQRLLGFIAWPLLGVLGASMVLDYRAALSIAGEAYDNALASTAIALVTRLERDDDDKDIEVDIPPAADQILRSDAVDKVLYVVFDEQGKVVAGDAELLQLPRPAAANRTVLQDVRLGGQRLRSASYRYESRKLTATVIVAETTLKRQHAANRILAAVFWPNLLLTGLALLLVYFGVRFALKPLEALGARIAERAQGDFSPLSEHQVPGEAGPLVRAINRLMQHLGEAGQAQQVFLSNAAHQLRTPLAGLSAQLELAVGAVPPEVRPRILRLQEAARRLVHFTHQMLALARSSSEGALIREHQTIPLGELLDEIVAGLLDVALAKGIDLGCETRPVSVEGSRWMLRELVANLVENALHYTPAGGRVTARCGESDAHEVFLEVEDDGPGIPASERSRVFERFYRLAGSAGPGTGLGLAIVREVADRHGARVGVEAGAEGRGTRVRVSFARGPTPPA